jgi:hypothetical protein
MEDFPNARKKGWSYANAERAGIRDSDLTHARVMKPIPMICFMAVSLPLAGNIHAQGFVNLGFETTTITPAYPGSTRYTATVPGWTWAPPGNFVNGDPNSVGYNELALDAPAVDLQGTNSPFAPAIRGQYSILLQGGSQFVPSTNYSAIWQTGQIPVTSQSLIYWGGALQVTFNGQPLTPVAIRNAANYTVWGMDISAYAGQTGELRFTKPWLPTNGSDGALLDNILFSSMQVPEPSAIALCSVSLLFFLSTKLTKQPNRTRQPMPGARLAAR